MGTITTGGLYAAPSVVPTQQTLTVTATSVVDTTKSSSAVVTLIPISVSVAPASVTLYGNGTQQFIATVSYSSNTGVNWTINPSVGTISNTGLYTAPASVTSAQSVTVTATSQVDGTKSASATVNLSPPISVSVAPPTATLYGGGSQQFTATVLYTGNTAVAWSLNAGAPGSISSSGLYTAPASIATQQTVMVTATSQADNTKSASATVTLYPPISVTVTPATAILYASGQQQFTPSVLYTSNTAVAWSLNSGAPGSISSSGLYTAPASISTQQVVTVTATSQADSTKTASATITLYPPISVTVSPSTATIYGGGTQNFMATVNNTNNQAVNWSIMGAGSINSSGVYTAPATVASVQTVTVTAISQANSNSTGSATITLSPPVSVTVTPSTATVYGGGMQAFSANVIYTTNTAVAWSLNPPTGAGTINSSGVYTAPAVVGTSQMVTVTATSQADTTKSSSATITLAPVSITVSPQTSVLYGGGTQTFTANVTNTSNANVGWMIVGAGSINASGLYTAPATITTQQTVTVTATSQADTTKTASATITLDPPVSVTVNPPTATVYGGASQQFQATVLYATNTGVTWSSMPATGAGTISSAGVYTAPATVSSAQAVTVTATSQQDTTKSASATVTLTPVSVTVNPPTATLYAGGTQQFAATVSYTSNTAVNWTINPSVGSVSATGLYTAPATIATQQTVTVTAASAFDSTKSASATITLYPPVSVTVSPSTATVYGGGTQAFTATVVNTMNTAVTWSISPANGAGSIDPNSGIYTAPATVSSQQTITVTATSQANNAVMGTATITLSPPVSVTVTPTTPTVAAGTTQQFSAAVQYSSNTAVNWTLNPATGAGTISSTGLYTAPASVATQETVMVTATSQADGTKSATASITLTPSGGVTITPSTVTLSAGQTQQFTATVGVTWSISPASVGSIDSNGLYTAPSCVDNGQTVTVTATSTSNPSQIATATITFSAASNGYNYKRTIIVHSTQFVYTDEPNFPVLINVTDPTLASTVNNGHVSNPNGYDIAFTSDPTCQTSLNYELQIWNGVTGQLTAWVQIPLLSAESDTPLYLCYGNPAINADQSNKNGVWTNSYTGVWHLGDGVTLLPADSTANGNDATIVNAVAAPGEIGGAASFNGSNAYITLPPGVFSSVPSTPQTQGALTFELWYKTTSPSGVLLGGQDSAVGGAPDVYNSLLSFTTSQVLGDFYQLDPGGCCEGSAPNTYSDGNWHQFVDIYGYGFDEVWIDGNFVGSPFGPEAIPAALRSGALRSAALKPEKSALSVPGPAIGTPTGQYSTDTAFQLGAAYTGASGWSYFNGTMAEVRAASVQRDGDWIAAEFANISSPSTFYTVYAENAPAVDLTPQSAMLTNFETYQFTATTFGTCSPAVTWSISPAGQGTIDNTGLYTVPANLVANQTVTVTATSVSDPNFSASATVSLTPTVGITVSPGTATIGTSGTMQFSATVTGTTNTAVTWSISPSIGSIDSNGLYTAPACSFGAVTITATSVADSTQSATAVISFANGSGGSGFNYRHPIVVNHTKVSNSDQPNFPLLINTTDPTLAWSGNGGSGNVQSQSGYDIAFTSDATCQSLLNYEIEEWDPVAGTLVAWVQLPLLSHSADTTIYLCYGNASIQAQLNTPALTWDSNYSAVFHFLNTSGQQDSDSTSNANSSPAIEAGRLVPGQIGYGVQPNYYPGVVTNTNNFPGGAAPRTVSIWVNSTTDQGVIFGYGTSGAETFAPAPPTGQMFGAYISGERLWVLTTANIPADQTETNFIVQPNQWYYLTETYDGTTLTIYMNGAQVFSQAIALNTPTSYSTIGGSIGSLYFVSFPGTNNDSGILYLQGILDEFRVSNIVRSVDWMTTEYNNQSSPATFYTFYPQNSVAVTISPVTATLYNSQTLQFTAAAQANCSAGGVTWSLNPSNAGTLSDTGLYTAPATIAGPQTVTVTATSTSDTSHSANATVTLLPLGSISVSPQTATLSASQTQQFTSVVANANPAVTWSVSPSGLGSIDANGLYTAPPCVTTQQIVTVTAASVANPGATATATITLFNTNGYGFRRAIIIDHSKIPNTDQTNFPFLFSTTDPVFASVANGGHVNSSSGYDIIFSTDPYGLTKLDHELDQYNPATGQLVAWVRVPALSHSTDTVLYVFYGNPVVSTAQANPTGVWGVNYTGVYHMGNGTILSESDSSVYGNNGTAQLATAGPGLIGGGVSFAGLQMGNWPELDMGNSISLVPTLAVTVSGWFNTTAAQYGLNSTLISKSEDGDGYSLSFSGGSNNGIIFQILDQNSRTHSVAAAAGGLNDGNWHYAVGTYDGNNLNVYVTGL